VRLAESALLEVPAVIGWLKPVILVPASALAGLSPHELDGILAHELAHVRRNDYLVNLIQTLIETLLFYHPATWWIGRVIRRERENCCDDLAAGACGDALVYAGALARLEELRGPGTGLALGAHGAALLPRIRRLLNRPAPVRARRSWSLSATALLLACVLAPLAAVQLSARAQNHKPAEPTTQPAAAPATSPAAAPGEPAADPNGDQAMEAMLEKKLPELQFDNVAFSDVIDFLRDVTGVNIFVNWRSLEAAGLDRNVPVTLRVRNITLRKVLQLIMQSAEPNGMLSMDVDENVISIASAQPDVPATSAPAPTTPPGATPSLPPEGASSSNPMSGAAPETSRHPLRSSPETPIASDDPFAGKGVGISEKDSPEQKLQKLQRFSEAVNAESNSTRNTLETMRLNLGSNNPRVQELGRRLRNLTDRQRELSGQIELLNQQLGLKVGQYFISGVPRTGTYALVGDTPVTLRQALLSAGVTQDAGACNVNLRSNSFEDPKGRSYSLKSILAGEQDKQLLHDGDVVMVFAASSTPTTQPVSGEYYIGGHVPRVGVYSMGRPVNLLQALVAAGVNPPDASDAVVTLIRPSGNPQQPRKIPMRQIIDDPSMAGLLVHAKDQIIVSGSESAPATQPAVTR
jgi:hypothetical protein